MGTLITVKANHHLISSTFLFDLGASRTKCPAWDHYLFSFLERWQFPSVIKALCLPALHSYHFHTNTKKKLSMTKKCRSDSPPIVLLSDKLSPKGFTLLVSHNQNKSPCEGDTEWEQEDNILINTTLDFMSWGHNMGNKLVLPQPSWDDIIWIFSDADSNTSCYCYDTDPFKQKVSDGLKDYMWKWSLLIPVGLILLKKWEWRTCSQVFSPQGVGCCAGQCWEASMYYIYLRQW